MSHTLAFYGTKPVIGLPYGSSSQQWTRPAEWIALDMPAANEEKFVGLYLLYEGCENPCAVWARGAYTVNWGDGNSENVADNTQGEHFYNWNAVTETGMFTGPSGVRVKQVIITVTPQGGQYLTQVGTSRRVTALGLTLHTSMWADIAVNGPNLTNLWLGTSGTVPSVLLERIRIGVTGAITGSNTFAFANLTALRVLDWSNPNTANVTDWTAFFSGCGSLQSVPSINFAGATKLDSLFSGCYSLRGVPPINCGASMTSCTNMFYNCYSLLGVTLFDTQSVTDMTGMFQNCYSLVNVPSLNTSKCANFTNMFNSCMALETVPLLDTSGATPASTTCASMFGNCRSLTSVPNFDFSKVTSLAGTFASCYTIPKFPAFTVGNGCLNFSTMFSDCYALTDMPTINTAGGTDFISMFNNCSRLAVVGALDLTAATTAGKLATMFGGTSTGSNNLRRLRITNIKDSLVIPWKSLSREALIDIFKNLSSSATGKTLTVTHSPGLKDMEPKVIAVASSEDVGDTITTAVPHGMGINQPFVIVGGVASLGLLMGTIYYVKALDGTNPATKFTVATTQGTWDTGGTGKAITGDIGACQILTWFLTLTTSAATDDIIRTTMPHGFVAGDKIVFGLVTGGSTGAPVAGTPYYVLDSNLGERQFQLSATRNGAALNWATNITAGYVVNYPTEITNSPAANNTINTHSAHGFASGDLVRFIGIDGSGTPANATPYRVVNPTLTSFQISADLADGDPIVTFGGDITLGSVCRYDKYHAHSAWTLMPHRGI